VTKAIHLTKQSLIDAACELLENLRADEIQVDEVLQHSGISKGSLYHHFEDFAELIETALVTRFVIGADRDLAYLTTIFETSTSQNDLLAKLEIVTERTQSEANKARRFERAEVLARSQRNPRLQTLLAREQQRVTNEFTELVKLGQQKGWFRQDISASAVAVLIQAYTLGRLIDDIAEHPIQVSDWNSLINEVLHKALAS
jgi:AcrR family transcriptional regulator